MTVSATEHAKNANAPHARGGHPDLALNIRGDFPIFSRRFDGQPLVYLDSGATSQKPAVVIDAISSYLSERNANVHRGVYALAQESDAAYDGAREKVAGFLSWEPRTTIFTKNVTEAINLVAYAWGRANVGPADAVLITQMEHHANIVPWQVLCRERGAELRYLEVDERGELSLDQLDRELARGDVKLVAFTHVSNVLGTIVPVAEMTARIRAAGATSLVDGAQAVPHMPVDLNSLGADFYAWTGHKALGPTGIGVLHGRAEILNEMQPFLTGGDMIASVDFDGATWNELPYKFEAGTPPIAEAVGLGAAVDYLTALGMEQVRAHERELTGYLLARLQEVPGLRFVGPPEAENRGGLVSFTIEGMHAHDIAELANRGGVCIRAGHHCAQPLMRCLGVGATARASVGVYNEPSDVDALIDALQAGLKVFGL
ncbi:MAG TPA: SufS family cysteine desulfurase [Solirubrobacteraceae bacterium]|jgi:cysteine desulfurase/selenocysteine lyase|nr:SufS family cysteine desulfurase [Solirubrobacteraceae bacterium]